MDGGLDTLVIGSGLSGLAAAGRLQDAGQRVLVVDKGRGIGGRLANRRFGGAVFDMGAQFFTARDPAFLSLVKTWEETGKVKPWYTDRGGIKWRGAPAMSELAKTLGEGLPVQQKAEIASVAYGDTGWVVTAQNGEIFAAKSLVMTAPLPQAQTLLTEQAPEVAATLANVHQRVSYDRCLAVMAVLDGPSGVPAPGVHRSETGPIYWLADNQQKGISEVPAITLHASAAFSLEHWDSNRNEVGQVLLSHAKAWVTAKVIDFQVHGWKFSRPRGNMPHGQALIAESPDLVLAGDALLGGRVEGAVLSGWEAADTLLRRT